MRALFRANAMRIDLDRWGVGGGGVGRLEVRIM